MVQCLTEKEVDVHPRVQKYSSPPSREIKLVSNVVITELYYTLFNTYDRLRLVSKSFEKMLKLIFNLYFN